MASGGTTLAGTLGIPGMRQRFGKLLGGDVDSDDEEEGGTPLTESFAPPPSGLGDTSTGAPRDKPDKLGKDIQAAPNQLRSGSQSLPNANSILDWFLGRRIYSTPEDLTNEPGSRVWEQNQGVDDDNFDIGDVRDICPACTTPYCQAVDSVPFQSSLKLMYNDPMSHKWLIGNKYVLHEAVDNHPEDEYVPLVEACRALKTLASEVPTPKVRSGWKENGKVITISDTVRGERLYDIWWDISAEEREHIAKQVVRYVESWRETDLGRISSLTGGPVHHHDNLLGTMKGGFGPFGSDLDLWQAIERQLERKCIDEDTIQLLRDYMPPSSPCVFTHGDLSTTNIIVHKGEVSAITGFENAASLPVWAENVAMHFCCCVEDEQWKALLSKYTRNYRAALDWWSLWTAVEDGDIDPVRLESLKDRCRRWKKTEILGQPFWSVWLSNEGGASKRMNIQTVENAVEARVGNLVRRAIEPDLLRYEDLPSDTSWGCSTDDEQGDGSEHDEGDASAEKSSAGRKRGLAPYHRIQQQHHTLVTSANGPPRHALEALGREHRKPPPKPLPLGSFSEKRRNYAPIAIRDPSDSDSESDVESTQSRPQSSERPELSEGLRPTSKGLRPLSLPSFALSESARTQLRSAGEEVAASTSSISTARDETIALQSIREDASGPKPVDRASPDEEEGRSLPRREKRTSVFRNRAKPGSLYAALSAASTEARPRRHVRSRSEERTFAGDVLADASRARPQSMLQPNAPAFRHDGAEGRNRGRAGGEEEG